MPDTPWWIFCKIMFAIIFPPIGTLFVAGPSPDAWVNVYLTLLGWIPGVIHALYLIVTFHRRQAARERGQLNLDLPPPKWGIWSRSVLIGDEDEPTRPADIENPDIPKSHRKGKQPLRVRIADPSDSGEAIGTPGPEVANTPPPLSIVSTPVHGLPTHGVSQVTQSSKTQVGVEEYKMQDLTPCSLSPTLGRTTPDQPSSSSSSASLFFDNHTMVAEHPLTPPPWSPDVVPDLR
ncbi:hypothetical protein BU23DRAFT_573230 [Bimuria novae-zelandiae CBS 107.79]|uniref:Uncharacterized protein n=1 Tax=Bimuria novae-zelandiae CBS 107.79 TaxID=1447943 RepID=A0A6A5UUR1_9PLEO|nr:hypothetical protein BU23DRAFT_573230 [Bimuria novae-zelandiae CBS 107.79]